MVRQRTLLLNISQFRFAEMLDHHGSRRGGRYRSHCSNGEHQSRNETLTARVMEWFWRHAITRWLMIILDIVGHGRRHFGKPAESFIFHSGRRFVGWLTPTATVTMNSAELLHSDNGRLTWLKGLKLTA